MPLRQRLFISSLLGAVPLTVLGILLLLLIFRDGREQLQQQSLAQAELAAAYVEGWVSGYQRTLRTLAESNEVKHGVSTDVRGLIGRQLPAQPQWDNLFVTDAAGRVTNAGRPLTFNVAEQDFFLRMKAAPAAAVSNALDGQVGKHQVIILAYPITRNGAFAGIIGAVIPGETVLMLFRRKPMAESIRFGLWGSDHRLIAHSRAPASALGGEYPDARVARQLFSGKSGTLIADSTIIQQRVIYGFSPVVNTPWTVVVSMPLSETLFPLYRLTFLFAGIAALVIALTLFWSAYSASLVAREVRLLAESAQRVGEGQLDTRVHSSIGGELEDLAESLNRMAADLEATERLKSEFLSMVSHELKTPLTSIRASLDLLTGDYAQLGEKRSRELMEIAERQTHRLQDMIENLLAVARLDTGALAISPKPIPLRPVILASVEHYQAQASERGLDVVVEAPEDLYALADAAKVTLALDNLLDNAIKFTRAGEILIRAEAKGREAVITVTDTGIGITPEVRDRLFSRFYQAEPLMTRKASGAGLGLVVVKAVAEAHGGRAFAHSAGPNAGSTFGFTLPLAPVPAAVDTPGEE
ncbi:MAG: sensor histidine kinase [Armatimonadota bacterium]